jgi:hypothetical protein
MQIIGKIQGLDEAIKLLDQLPDKMQRTAILNIFRKSTRPMINAAKTKLQGYGAGYGKLAKTIGNIAAKGKNPVIYVGPRVKGAFKDIGYTAHWVEYGAKGLKKSRGGSVRKDADRPYAKFVGRIPKGKRYRKDQPAKPFMRPAIDEQKGTVKQNVEKDLKNLITREVEKAVAKMNRK